MSESSSGYSKWVIGSIVVVVIIVVITVVWSSGEAKEPPKAVKPPPPEKLIESKMCQFCGKPATLVRKPDPGKVLQWTNWVGREPSYAEMQIVYCCDECKAVAGGFKTTVWSSVV